MFVVLIYKQQYSHNVTCMWLLCRMFSSGRAVWVGLIEQYHIHAASESHLPHKSFWHDGWVEGQRVHGSPDVYGLYVGELRSGLMFPLCGEGSRLNTCSLWWCAKETTYKSIIISRVNERLTLDRNYTPPVYVSHSCLRIFSPHTQLFQC